jgi:hypothetical protein
MLTFLMGGIYDVRHLGSFISEIYLPVFMKICPGVQAVLRFCLSSLNGCNVDITNGRDL